MSQPNPSSAPRPAVRIITSYDVDVSGAADALVATLRPTPQPDAQAPNPKLRENPYSESTAEHSTPALREAPAPGGNQPALR